MDNEKLNFRFFTQKKKFENSYSILLCAILEKDRCLTFDYNMGDNSNGDYQTIVRVHREGKGKEGITREQLWELSSTTNYKWNKASIDIHSMRKLKVTRHDNCKWRRPHYDLKITSPKPYTCVC